MVRDCRPDDIGMSVSYPLPGTKFHERVKVQLGAQQNWRDSADLAMMYAGPFATPFYRQLHRVLHLEFRARKSWDELRGLVRRPLAVRPGHLRQAAGLVYRRLALPWSRYRLNRLEQAPHRGLQTLPVVLTLEEAARPTPQGE
jgi:hypothetical protein